MTLTDQETSQINPSPLLSSDPVIQITIPVSTKLDRKNFLTWESQIEPIVHGFGLAHHLDASVSPPNKQIEVGGQSIPNPAYLAWHKQDCLLLGWLRSTISGAVLSQYVRCKTAADLWTALHRVYSAISSARIMELRRRLQTTVRGGTSCNEYFEQMQGIADQLSAAGEPIEDSDLIRYVLNGLGSDFNSFVVALTTRAEPISIFELHGFLLTHEALINSQSEPLPSPDPQALYASTTGRGRGRGKGNRGRGGPPLLPTPTGRGRGGPFQAPGSFHPGRGAPSQSQQFNVQGRGGSFQSSTVPPEEKPICQICKKRGHDALICWYRFDNAYTADAPSSFQAFVNTTSASPSEGWFLDSGATHHVTSDINNLSSSVPYLGNDHLQVGPPHYETASSSTPH